MTDDDIVTRILEREAGFVDRAEDKGGPTNRGITIATLALWRGHPVTRADVLELGEVETRQIYLALFIRRPGFARIADPALRELVVDAGVLSGTRHAAEWLQKVLGVRQDGVLGPFTMSALGATPARTVFLGFCALRMRLIGRIITRDPSQSIFAAGWMNRIADFVAAAP